MSFITLQLRRDTAANWTAANPTLASGEIGLETDTDQIKIGDGATAWNSLGYGGIQGPAGAAGVGVPSGGTTGQALIKNSNSNYDTTWGTVTSNPAGSDTQIQFNDGGAFAGDAGLTFNKTTNALTIGAGTLNFTGSSSGTITIQPAAAAGTYTLTLPTDDGSAGQALLTDGSGVLSWGAVGGTPGGSDTQVQFNDGGAFGGNSALTFNKTTGAFSASTVTASATTANTSAISATSYSVTGSSSANMVDLAGTWNTSGSPTGIKLNVTNTASGAGTNLMDLQIGGASRFRVDRDGDLILGGATVTANSPVIDAAQTWNAGGVTFTGMKLNVTDTASASGSLLMDLRVGSNAFTIDKDARIVARGYLAHDLSVAVARAGTSAGIRMASDARLDFTSTSTALGTPDTFLTRRAAANLRLGAADAAAPVAQTLSVQSVVAGTSNTAGANLTITGSQGTGTGAGGSIIFQVAPAGSSGTAQNALADALTIAPSSITSAHQVRLPNGSASTPAIAFTSQTAAGWFKQGEAWAFKQDNVGGIFALGRTGSGTDGLVIINGTPIVWSSAFGTASNTQITRVGDGILGIRGASGAGAALSLVEQTAPSAPATNGVYIFAEDNGSGKTRLMALFATGAAQQIAIEP